jgi:hypothetical protein
MKLNLLIMAATVAAQEVWTSIQSMEAFYTDETLAHPTSTVNIISMSSEDYASADEAEAVEQSFIQVFFSEIGGTSYAIKWACLSGCDAALPEVMGTYRYSETSTREGALDPWYEYLVLRLPEAIKDSLDEANPTKVVIGFQSNAIDGNQLRDKTKSDEYYKITYTIKSDRTVVAYNEGCTRDSADFPASVSMTGLQNRIYSLVNTYVASNVGLGCTWDNLFQVYMDNYQPYTEMIVTTAMGSVYAITMASSALFWDNLPFQWKALLMAVPEDIDPMTLIDGAFLNF